MAKMNRFYKLLDALKKFVPWLRSLFLKKSSAQTKKQDFNFRSILMLVGVFTLLFVGIVLFMPTPDQTKFHEVAKLTEMKNGDQGKPLPSNPGSPSLWASPSSMRSSNAGSSNSQNTPMQVLPHNGNSKLELSAGTHLRLRIVDKFIASQEPVPVMGKVIESATTESGLSIPEGALLYGEASYQKASGRAVIQFRKLSYPSGEIRNVSANVVSADGMPGLEGTVHSDRLKNSAGQFITTFVGALTAGSVQRDLMGNSQGGLQNGLLSGASEVAKNQAQKYGESLKESREWIEVGAGAECDAIIEQSYKMIESEVNP
jgi:hypothetical protein